MREKTIKICPVCEKEFIPEKNNRQIYCSKECSGKAKLKRAKEIAEMTRAERPKQICDYCKKIFKPINNRQRFCCKNCGVKGRNTLKRYRYYKYDGISTDDKGKKLTFKKITTRGKRWKNATPLDRWHNMSIDEINAECAKRHITYGQAQTLKYQNRLPEDWGL